MLSLAAFASAGFARAADLPVKAAKKAADLPFFLLIDDRVTFSWMPKGTDPGVFSVRPDGSINGTTAKQSIRSRISTYGSTAPISSPFRCSSRITTIRRTRAPMRA